MTPDWSEDWDVYDMDSCLFDDDGGGPCGYPAVAHFLYPKEGYFASYGTQDRVSILCARHAKYHPDIAGRIAVTLDELAIMQIMES